MALLSDHSLSLAVGGSEACGVGGFLTASFGACGNFLTSTGKFHTIAWEVLPLSFYSAFGSCAGSYRVQNHNTFTVKRSSIVSISVKSILAAAASLVVGNAMAADGTINFKGEITAAACGITGGAGTTVGGAAGNQTIDVNLGKISIDSLSGTAGGGIAGGTSLNLNLDCGKTGTGLTTVKLKFDPMSGTASIRITKAC